VVRYESGIADVDEISFGHLLDDVRPAALRLATVVLGTAQGADDVVQVAFERAWRARDTYDTARAFRPWLFRIVANTARNDRRSRGRQAHLALRVAGRPEPANDSIEDDVVTADERRVVLAGLNRLADGDREVIALRYFEDLSEAEMAIALDCRPGTVKSRLSRAMKRLRAELGSESPDRATDG
jgi:RNA polymerase sigma factor (sigma-70 family)